MVGKIQRMHSQQLLSEGLPAYTPTHSSRLYKILREENGKGQNRYIAIFVQDGSKQALLTTSTSSARSSTASGNLIMLAIANAVH